MMRVSSLFSTATVLSGSRLLIFFAKMRLENTWLQQNEERNMRGTVTKFKGPLGKMAVDAVVGFAGEAADDLAFDNKLPKVWSKPSVGGTIGSTAYRGVIKPMVTNAPYAHTEDEAKLQGGHNGLDEEEVEQLYNGSGDYSSTLQQKLSALKFSQEEDDLPELLDDDDGWENEVSNPQKGPCEGVAESHVKWRMAQIESVKADAKAADPKSTMSDWEAFEQVRKKDYD